MNVPINWLQKHRSRVVPVALAAFTLLLFWPAFSFEFIRYDDYEYVKENLHVSTGLTVDNISWAFRNSYASNWHPLTWISHMVDVELFGMNAGGHHAVNALFHTFNTVLLFFVVRKMTGKFWSSAMVAALFGWHPLHVQSVAWVSERKDVLSAFFAIWTLFFYLRYIEKARASVAPSGRKGAFEYCLALLFFALGLMSKPMLVTLPLLLLLLDFWPLRRFASAGALAGDLKSTATVEPSCLPFNQVRARFLLLEKIPFFTLVLASVLVTLWAQQGAIRSLQQLPLSLRLQNAPVSVLSYIGKMILPFDLAILYPFPESISFLDVALTALLLILGSAAAVRYARRLPFLFVGWFWFLIGLLPVIGLVQVGTQAMADRYTYLPMIGLFIAVVWIVPEFVRARGLAFVSVASLMLCWVDARFQLQYWKDDFTVFQRAAEVTDNNIVAYDHVADDLIASGQSDAALTMYKEAVRLNPREANMHNNLGQLLARAGNFNDAIQEFSEAIRLNSNCARAYSNLGAVLATKGELAEGIRHLLNAVHLAPDDAQVHVNLANVLLRQGKPSEALPHFTEAIRLEPEDPSMRYLVAKSLSPDYPELAIEQFHAAIKRRPEWLAPISELAWLLATHPKDAARDGRTAVQLAQRACALTQDQDAKCLGILDAAYAEAGRFPEALETAEKVRALSLRLGKPELATAAERRMALYRSGQPFRQK